MADYTGNTLDEKYEIIELIGEGGMGAVYRGRHIAIGKAVAIKFLHASLTSQEEVVKRFYREAQAAAAIRHSNIIDVMDLGVSPEGEPYLVMEYLEGQGLADHLDGEGKLDLPSACAIAEAALVALDAAHEQNIVHRDLKPDNIFLVNRPGEPLSIKIIDFGISKFLAIPDQTKLTQDGSMLGTPAYMSPEQARGSDAVDHRTDLYAMGVIFYQMLTGAVPYTGVNYSELLLNMLTGEPRDPASINPDFPEQARPIIEKALQKEPKDRFQSAGEMLKAIRALVGVEERVKHLTMLAAAMTDKTLRLGAPGDIGVDDTRIAERLYSNMLKRKKRSTSSKRGDSVLTALNTGIHAVVKGTRIIYGCVRKSKWPSLAWTTTTRLFGKLVRHPKRAVPISFFGTVALLLALTPLLCSESTAEVSITLKNLPKDAVVFFDETKVSENPFTVSATDKAATLRIEAKGKKPFTKAIVPKKDRIVEVILHAEKKKTQTEKKKTEKPPQKSKPEVEKKTDPEKTETEPAKTKKKQRRRKPRFKWPFRRKRKTSKNGS